MYYKVNHYCFWHFILFLLQITAMFLEKNHYSGFAFFWIGYKSTNTILRNLLQINNCCASLRSLIVSLFLSEKLSCSCSFLLVLQNSNVKKTFERSIQINSKSIKNNRFVKNVSRTSLFTGGFLHTAGHSGSQAFTHISYGRFRCKRLLTSDLWCGELERMGNYKRAWTHSNIHFKLYV